MSENTSLKEEVFNCCLENLADQAALDWFTEKAKLLETASAFFLNFGMLKRKVKNGSVHISPLLKSKLQSVNPAFSVEDWDLVSFCRLAFLLQLNTPENKVKIETLLASADIKEQVIIYRALQYLENAEDFKLNIIDGIRTNMIDVFDAIALENNYAFTYFSEDAWNHMVLKAIFMERPIYRIHGIDQRKNKKLAGILQDFVHERWAAGRVVTPELWRMISGFTTESIIGDLKNAVLIDTDLGKAAAQKVLEDAGQMEWIKSQGLEPVKLTWEEIGKEIWEA
ncbi:EboA domain-containing protein [uncultured Arcticibacterium sp.]|uniref:EboA domain-containing protein n=1 Tax=uncultured Arcticibacterium sp. TaxID=2173042 RepID=UPI0030F92F07